MAKKKINPNRIPISEDSFDIKQIVTDATSGMVLRAWALVLGALADFPETTTETLLQLWHSVNRYSSSVHHYDDVANDLKEVERITSLSAPYERIPSSTIKTQGDLDKFTRRVHQNALFAAFALIANPIIRHQLLSEEAIARVFHKAYSMDEEICLGKKGRVSLQDILDMLEDEFSIRLFDDNGRVTLYHLAHPRSE